MMGIALGALTLRGFLNGAATMLCCYSVLGLLDPYAGYMYRGHFVKNDLIHVVTGFLFAGLGVWILRK